MVTDRRQLPLDAQLVRRQRRASLYMFLGAVQILTFILMVFGVAIKIASLNPMVRKIAEEDSNPLLLVNLPWYYIGALGFFVVVNWYILKTKFKDVLEEELELGESWASD